MDGFIKNLRYVDYLSAAASLGWAAYTQSWLWLAFGLLSVALAWYSPSTRINLIAQKYLVKRKSPPKKMLSPSDVHVEEDKALSTMGHPMPLPDAPSRPRRQSMYFVTPFEGCRDFSAQASRFLQKKKT